MTNIMKWVMLVEEEQSWGFGDEGVRQKKLMENVFAALNGQNGELTQMSIGVRRTPNGTR